MCWNVLNHLDAGVLADPYEGMFPKRNNTPTVLSQLYPITVGLCACVCARSRACVSLTHTLLVCATRLLTVSLCVCLRR